MAGRKHYGKHHQSLRKQWAKQVALGTIQCHRCGQLISPDHEWHLGHTDDRKGYLGPEHALCNMSAGGSIGAAITNGQRTSREW